MEIKTLFFTSEPHDAEYTMVDICWECSLERLALQFRGGWDVVKDKVRAYTTLAEAVADAEARLAHVKKG